MPTQSLVPCHAPVSEYSARDGHAHDAFEALERRLIAECGEGEVTRPLPATLAGGVA